jgi:hypothetical protein
LLAGFVPVASTKQLGKRDTFPPMTQGDFRTPGKRRNWPFADQQMDLIAFRGYGSAREAFAYCFEPSQVQPDHSGSPT